MVNRDRVDSRVSAGQEQALSGAQVVARVALIIGIAEIFIMVGINRLALAISPVSVALLDGLLLLVISIGPIFFWVVRPFARAHEVVSRHIGYLAYHDPLTDLPNRRLLFEHLERALAASERHHDYGAVMLLDLDGFKHINDVHGHDMGDYFLRRIAENLRSNKREEDIVARLGGDEFVVLAQQLGTDAHQAETKARTIASKLHRATLEPVNFEAEELKVGCSIGIRLIGPLRISPAQALRQADIAMYGAKKDPVSAIHVFRKSTPVEAEEIDGSDQRRAFAG
jgi:two-component system cell cycle response regulator